MFKEQKKMIADSSLPGLRVERFLDPQTGEADVHYLWNGVLVPKVLLTGKIANQISGLALIRKDLNNAKRWVQRAYDLTSEERAAAPEDTFYQHSEDRSRLDDAKAFFVAGLTFYGKAFTEAAGRNAQVQRDWLSLEFRDLHDHYMDFRHNFAAHSGDLKLEQSRSYLLLIPERGGATLRLGTFRMQPDVAGTKKQEASFISLLDHVMSVVSDRYFEAAKRLIEAAATRPLAFLYAAAQGGVPVDMDKTIATARKGKRK